MGGGKENSETKVVTNSFEVTVNKLKIEFQKKFQDIPIYEEMANTRLEYALGDNEDFLAVVYKKNPDDFYHDIKNTIETLKTTFDDLHNNHGYSYAAIMEAMKKEKRILYISPGFVVDEETGDEKHVGLFLADDNQFVITYHLEPPENVFVEARKLIGSGLLLK